jgi:hypothetical protein
MSEMNVKACVSSSLFIQLSNLSYLCTVLLICTSHVSRPCCEVESQMEPPSATKEQTPVLKCNIIPDLECIFRNEDAVVSIMNRLRAGQSWV